MLLGCAASCRGRRWTVRYAYGEHPSQYAELTLPAGSAPAPVVVVIHGGYWSASYGAELGRPLAVDLAGRGFAAVNVEYRRMGDGGGWPQTGQDVAAAVDALRGRPAGLDLTRVVALGHSAGGQLAAWLASARGGAVALTGAVLQAGVLDLVRGSDEGLGGGAVDAYLGGSPARDRTRTRRRHRLRWCRWAFRRSACTAPLTRWCRSASPRTSWMPRGGRVTQPSCGRSTVTTSIPSRSARRHGTCASTGCAGGRHWPLTNVGGPAECRMGEGAHPSTSRRTSSVRDEMPSFVKTLCR